MGSRCHMLWGFSTDCTDATVWPSGGRVVTLLHDSIFDCAILLKEEDEGCHTVWMDHIDV